MKLTVLVAAILTALLCATAVATANNSADFTFSTNANPASPQTFENLWGLPAATITVDPDSGTGWYDTLPAVYGSAQGWWDIGKGTIVVTIPDRPDAPPESSTDLWVSVTYWKDISEAPVVTASPGATFLDKKTYLVEAGPIMGGWYKDVWQWRFSPLPGLETITVTGDVEWGSQIDRIFIVPEPSSLMALCCGLAGLAGLVTRRRRV